MWYQPVGSSPLRVPCTCWPKLLRKRKSGRATLYPEKPPSPPVCFHRVVEPVYEKVPLSCVPPISDLRGRWGFTESVWNWMVLSPALREISLVGISERSCLQVLSWAGLSGVPLKLVRESHCAEAST